MAGCAPGVLAAEGPDRAHFLIESLIDAARQSGAYLPFSANTPYINSIPVGPAGALARQPQDRAEDPSNIRWNAMAMVLRANRDDGESAATFRASLRPRSSTRSASTISFARRRRTTPATWSIFQGHSSPAFMPAHF